nr:amino acid adenylation domain-containing protein [Mycolicibacterium xanthum]
METSAPTTDARSITELFESTVDRVPEAIAVTAVDGSLTYRQLDDAANRLARRLQHLGVRTGAAVGLCVGRTSSMAIGMLGILKAGGVYVPVDPSYPQDRIEHMLADAGVGLSLDEDGIDGADVGRYPADRLDIRTATNDLAYIMFTSGSTGRPKGVAISHGSVVEYAETLGREVGIRPDDVYLETASVSFSSSIRQLLLPFAVGAQVVIATTGERRDPAALLRRIRGSRVTVADLVPTVVRGVVETMAATVPEDRADLIPDSLRLLLTASEPLRAAVVRGWRDLMGPAATWINMYGQTETTGIVSLHRVGDPDGHDQSIVPIGRPRGNTGMYVLDRRLRPLPPGIDGELYIAGPALARGYLGPPEITAAKFVTAPWDYFERLYASGDMVRLRWDGTIEFRNRTDRQVKIRGLRVEPAEIDSVLLAHPGVREAVSAAQQTADASSVLVAYYVPEHAPVPLAELRAHVRRHLPEHMVPSTFVDLERLPQTPNGKLDRTALPVVVVSRDRDVEFVAPRDGVEESLAEIWRTTLHVDQIGAADNFFELGGHSLLAAQVRAQIHRVLGIELPLEALFEDQTLSDLARRIETDTGAHADEAPALVPAGRTTTLPISYAQELMWHAERDRPGSAAHWIDVSVRIGGRLDTGALVDGLQEAARRHELLRTTFRPSAGSVSQVILDPHSLDVPVLEHLPDAGGTNLCHDMADEWHDLDTRPPIRPELVRLSDDEHVLRLRVHRILADGYTMRLLLSEIGGLVATRLGFNDFPLLDGDLQYADYAVWERSWLTSTALTRRIDHFCAQFARSQPRDVLPTDHPRSHASLGVGRQFGFEFPDAAAHAVRALAVREQTSLYTVLLAGFAAALGRYAGQRTVVIGSPMTRRNHPATQLILGPFMNTVPLCIDLADAEDLSALVRATRAAMVGALANQDAPWQHVRAALVEQLGPIASGIGEIAFLMDEPTPDQFAVGGFTLTRIPAERVVARRALTVAMSTRNDQLTGTVTYDRALFDTTTIQHIVADFVSALSLSPADHT